MIRLNSISAICIAIIAASAGIARAADSPNDVLIANKVMHVTRADYEVALSRIPAELREEFASSGRRLTQFLNNVLVNKTLAAQARQEGLQPEVGMPTDTPEEMDRAMGAAKRRAIEEAAGDDFDARRATLVAAARENYLMAKDKYARPEQVKISAILISADVRGDEAAVALARATRDKALAWADFAALAREVSEDQASKPNGGSLPWASATQMDPAVAKTAMALTRVGEISEPLHVGNSYILVRLDEKRPAGQIPFDEVKDSIMAGMRNEHVNAEREAYLAAIRNDPEMKVDQDAIDALVKHIDPERFKPAAAGPSPIPAMK